MIALGCDHGGFELKQEIIAYLKARKIEYKDFGCYDNKSVDYPVYAKLVGKAIQSGECEKGILICGTGIGISIAANKMKGIRAAVCTDCFCFSFNNGQLRSRGIMTILHSRCFRSHITSAIIF